MSSPRNIVMTNPVDAAVATHISHAPTEELLGYFERKADEIVSDSAYWQLLAMVWIASGSTADLDRWRKLFSAKRRGRHKLMKKGDRRVWRGLPDPVIVFRALARGEDGAGAFSWSLDTERLRVMYPYRKIVSRQFSKERIIAYFDRRKEREVIVL